MKKLPKKFQGAEVVRGKGMTSEKMDALVESCALSNFEAMREMYLVVDDTALEDADDAVQVKGFTSKKEALLFARGRASGNVDQRVLRITSQVLVIATENDL